MTKLLFTVCRMKPLEKKKKLHPVHPAQQCHIDTKPAPQKTGVTSQLGGYPEENKDTSDIRVLLCIIIVHHLNCN